MLYLSHEGELISRRKVKKTFAFANGGFKRTSSVYAKKIRLVTIMIARYVDLIAFFMVYVFFEANY